MLIESSDAGDDDDDDDDNNGHDADACTSSRMHRRQMTSM